jgi:hypothetical protein
MLSCVSNRYYVNVVVDENILKGRFESIQIRRSNRVQLISFHLYFVSDFVCTLCVNVVVDENILKGRFLSIQIGRSNRVQLISFHLYVVSDFVCTQTLSRLRSITLFRQR